MIKHAMMILLFLTASFFNTALLFGMQFADTLDPEKLQSALTNDYMQVPLSSYTTLQKQVSMGYSKEIINDINDLHRKLLSQRYQIEPIRINEIFLSPCDKSSCSKICYKNKGNGFVGIYDTYTTCAMVSLPMLTQMPSGISTRKIVPVSKRLERLMHEHLTQKSILYEFYSQNRPSHWVIIENKTKWIKILPSIEASKNIPTAILRWEQNADLQVYLELEDGKKIFIHFEDDQWNNVIKLREEWKSFDIEVVDLATGNKRFHISAIGICDQKIMEINGYFFRELCELLPERPKQNDSCRDWLDRLCTNFVYKHENKIAAAIAFFTLFLLYKYHSCLFFGVSH